MAYEMPHPKDTFVINGLIYGQPRTVEKFGLRKNLVEARHAAEWHNEYAEREKKNVFYSVFKDDFPLRQHHHGDLYGLLMWKVVGHAKER